MLLDLVDEIQIQQKNKKKKEANTVFLVSKQFGIWVQKDLNLTEMKNQKFWCCALGGMVWKK